MLERESSSLLNDAACFLCCFLIGAEMFPWAFYWLDFAKLFLSQDQGHYYYDMYWAWTLKLLCCSWYLTSKATQKKATTDELLFFKKTRMKIKCYDNLAKSLETACGKMHFQDILSGASANFSAIITAFESKKKGKKSQH